MPSSGRDAAPHRTLAPIRVGEVRQELVDAVRRDERDRGRRADRRRGRHPTGATAVSWAMRRRTHSTSLVRRRVHVHTSRCGRPSIQRGVDRGVGGGDPFEQFVRTRDARLGQRPDRVDVGDALLDDAGPEVPHLADVPGEVAEVPAGARRRRGWSEGSSRRCRGSPTPSLRISRSARRRRVASSATYLRLAWRST